MPIRRTHVIKTKGRWYGHIFRRLVHISMLFVPLIYYSYGKNIAGFFHLSPSLFLIALLILTFILEFVRLRTGFVFFGQRKHEAKRISSFSWGVLGMVVVLIFSPGRAFSIPIIWSLALGDPFLGEMRRLIAMRWLVAFLGILFVLAIWWCCSFWFGISLGWGLLLAPITVAVEWFNLKWIDDNALMLLVPLILVLLVRHFLLTY